MIILHFWINLSGDYLPKITDHAGTIQAVAKKLGKRKYLRSRINKSTVDELRRHETKRKDDLEMAKPNMYLYWT